MTFWLQWSLCALLLLGWAASNILTSTEQESVSSSTMLIYLVGTIVGVTVAYIDYHFCRVVRFYAGTLKQIRLDNEIAKNISNPMMVSHNGK